MPKPTAAFSILVAASILTAGCSDSDARLTVAGPTPLRFDGAPFASIHPSVLTPQLIGSPACPAVQPLRVPVNLTVQAPGETSLLLTEVRMRFIDNLGVAAPQITLPAPALTRQFGTALVQARSGRSFPFDYSFGCGTDRIGTLVVFVRARDENGRDDSTEIRVGVR